MAPPSFLRCSHLALWHVTTLFTSLKQPGRSVSSQGTQSSGGGAPSGDGSAFQDNLGCCPLHLEQTVYCGLGPGAPLTTPIIPPPGHGGSLQRPFPNPPCVQAGAISLLSFTHPPSHGPTWLPSAGQALCWAWSHHVPPNRGERESGHLGTWSSLSEACPPFQGPCP